MAIEIDGVRPRVISSELAEELDDYRKFRHLFRHAYGGELRWKECSIWLKTLVCFTHWRKPA